MLQYDYMQGQFLLGHCMSDCWQPQLSVLALLLDMLAFFISRS